MGSAVKCHRVVAFAGCGSGASRDARSRADPALVRRQTPEPGPSIACAALAGRGRDAPGHRRGEVSKGRGCAAPADRWDRI